TACDGATLKSLRAQPEIQLSVIYRSAKRKLEHPNFVSRADHAAWQLESSPRSDRRKLHLFCQCALALVSRSGNFPSRFSQRHPGNGPNANSSGQRLSTEAGSASGGLTLARSGAAHDGGRQRALRSRTRLVATLPLI